MSDTHIPFEGASVYISGQEKGLPRNGVIAAIRGDDIIVEHFLRDEHKAAGIPETAVYPLDRLSISTPESISIVQKKTDAAIVVVEPDADEPVTSVITFSPYQAHDWSSPFLAVANAHMDLGDTRDFVRGRHPLARDVESDRVYRFYAELAFSKFEQATHGKVTWLAVPTEVRFFDPMKDSPFKRAVRKDDDADYTANSGYPYLPPKVTLVGTDILAPLRIEQHYGTDEELRGYLDRLAEWTPTN